MSEKKIHYLLGAVLILVVLGVAISLILINSQADSANTAVNISNNAPTVESLVLSDDAEIGDGQQLADDYGGEGGTINSLVAGSTKNVYLNGIVEDLNGREDITTVGGVLYRGLTTFGCAADKNDCYRDASCNTYDGPTANQLYFSCGPLALSYFADSTLIGGGHLLDNWRIRAFVSDGKGAGFLEVTKEMQTLLSLGIPDTIDYGTLSLGQSTTAQTNQAIIISQRGNDEADVEVSSSSAMTCTVGTIPIANQRWSLTDVDYGDESATTLSDSAINTYLNIGYQTDEDTAPTKSLYWNISIPTTGVGGSCSGNSIISAVAH